MTGSVEITCRICGSEKTLTLRHSSLLFPNRSSNPDLHEYENMLCGGCGVVFQHPAISESDLVSYYNGQYRASDYAAVIDDWRLEPPIDIPWSGVSLKRFETFGRMVAELQKTDPSVAPSAGDTLIDYGGYQGMFAHAAKSFWGCDALVYDFNEAGIRFAREALNLPASQVAKDIYTDRFGGKVKFCSLVHVFEHLSDPARFLAHLRENVLEPDGILYLEVPNIFGSPLSDPTHFYTYSPDSLSYVLRRNGFEPLALREHQDPAISRPTWSNDRLNISVLARPGSATESPALPSFDRETLARDIRKSHAACRRRIVTRQAEQFCKEAARMIYYAVFGLVLERISLRLATRLRSLLRKAP